MPALNPISDFHTHGWLRIPAAFSAEEAAAMREVVWRALAATGILRDDPATWLEERPQHLQRLKNDPVFQAVGSERTLTAIDEVLEHQRWRQPAGLGRVLPTVPEQAAVERAN